MNTTHDNVPNRRNLCHVFAHVIPNLDDGLWNDVG
jgi:hypothetical protein